MLDSGEKKIALWETKKNILTLVFEKQISVRKNNHSHSQPPLPSLQVKWSVPYVCWLY